MHLHVKYFASRWQYILEHRTSLRIISEWRFLLFSSLFVLVHDANRIETRVSALCSLPFLLPASVVE